MPGKHIRVYSEMQNELLQSQKRGHLLITNAQVTSFDPLGHNAQKCPEYLFKVLWKKLGLSRDDTEYIIMNKFHLKVALTAC